jgi:hypothetical protein
MRELAHIYPDGNLLLFGSPLPPARQDPASQETAGGADTAGAGPRTIAEDEPAT